ncbi:MAG TPA: polyprenyl diphosphate synthase [Roseiarcus sp.]|nr:polyprenyl diphosphate synthase [Roseiarcus sp.]
MHARRMWNFLYQCYEQRLRRQIGAGRLPEHVGLILDGNRRYAREQGFPDPSQAYQMGAQKLDDVLMWCNDLGIPAVTLWVCSTENLKRSRAEVSWILGAVEAKIGALAQDPWIHQRRVRVKVAGRLGLLPLSTVAVIRKAEEATAKYDAMILTIAVAYGGREEIVDAVRDLIRAKARDGLGLDELAEQITPAAIDQYLYTVGLPDPDLIIRTSGEVRLSGFLLWQSVQSEFYFTDVYWPEFRKVDFLRAIRTFQQRTRRFGQ